MRRVLTALALITAASAAANADCKGEVEAALEKQRNTSAFRMETRMVSPEGLVNMTVDYVLPDRMRQTVSTQNDSNPVETVLIDKTAWSNNGKGWQLLSPQVTGQLVVQMEQNVGEDREGRMGDFECLGKQEYKGKELLAYQGENNDGGPKNLSPEPADRRPDRPVRVFYVDPVTGLPSASIFARANKLDKPIFAATYSYPPDIKIEPPATPVE